MEKIPPTSFVFEIERLSGELHISSAERAIYGYELECKNKDELRNFLENCYVKVNETVKTLKEFLSGIANIGIESVEIQAKIIFIKPFSHPGPYDVFIETDTSLKDFRIFASMPKIDLKLAILIPTRLKIDDEFFEITFQDNYGWYSYGLTGLCYDGVEINGLYHYVVAPIEIKERIDELAHVLGYGLYEWYKLVKDIIIKKEKEEVKKLERQVTELEKPVTKEESVTEKRLKVKYEEKRPDWRVLEEIVKDVLSDLGFKVETNKKLDAKGGQKIEADVWGLKLIGNTRFYVYASCKNWDRKVDRDVILNEVGRIANLIQTPHLKIFVAKELTDSARETALIDGFTVIELGEKASTDNAKEIYIIIHKHLRDLFVGIAPPELQRFAKEAKEISERLRSLAEEIERISS